MGILRNIKKIIKLKAFTKFENITNACKAVKALNDGRIPADLRKLITKNIGIHDRLGVHDVKLGSTINRKFGINCVYNKNIQELMRYIRSNLENLNTAAGIQNYNHMSLGLSHSVSSRNLHFPHDKAEIMIIQAINLLDALDKEINGYSSRAIEWFTIIIQHFPELKNIVTEKNVYVKLVSIMGTRENITINN